MVKLIRPLLIAGLLEIRSPGPNKLFDLITGKSGGKYCDAQKLVKKRLDCYLEPFIIKNKVSSINGSSLKVLSYRWTNFTTNIGKMTKPMRIKIEAEVVNGQNLQMNFTADVMVDDIELINCGGEMKMSELSDGSFSFFVCRNSLSARQMCKELHRGLPMFLF